MIRSDLIKFESCIKCADSTVPLLAGNVHIHTQPVAFDLEAQSTIYLTYHFLTFMLLHLKRGLQS